MIKLIIKCVCVAVVTFIIMFGLVLIANSNYKMTFELNDNLTDILEISSTTKLHQSCYDGCYYLTDLYLERNVEGYLLDLNVDITNECYDYCQYKYFRGFEE